MVYTWVIMRTVFDWVGSGIINYVINYVISNILPPFFSTSGICCLFLFFLCFYIIINIKKYWSGMGLKYTEFHSQRNSLFKL